MRCIPNSVGKGMAIAECQLKINWAFLTSSLCRLIGNWAIIAFNKITGVKFRSQVIELENKEGYSSELQSRTQFY